MKIALHIVLGIVLLCVAISFVLVYVNTHPPRTSFRIRPSDLGATYASAEFPTEDGLTLRGWVILPDYAERKGPAVIFCHGLGADRSDLADLAVQLSRRGYRVLLFDFRAHGESGGARSSLGYEEQKDLRAALRYLIGRGDVDPKRIGVFGFSMGGAVAIMTAARTGQFAAVAADSAFVSLWDQTRQAITGFYHLPAFPFVPLAVLGYELYFQTSVRNVDPEAVIGRIAPAPVLLIIGEGDELIPAENGRRLFRAAHEPKELWSVPVSGHGGTIVSAGAEYERRVGAFFDRYLRPAGGRGQ